jgi:hypothetical protein
MLRLSAALAVSVLLAGCAYEPGPGPYYGGGAYVVGEPIGYDGFYDDYYGPFYDGYWARDGYFYYRHGEGGRFQRDVGGHFRHDNHVGFHAVHGGAFRGGGGHPGGGGAHH